MKEYLFLKDAAATTIPGYFASVIHKRDLWLCGFDEVSYAKKHYAIVVDGEIYNTAEIKEELHDAQYPPIESIEELFIYAYLHWKDDMMLHLKGAYAFIIQHDDILFAAKDPLGLAIQYYYDDHGCFCMSNSVDMMLKNASIPRILNHQGLQNLFAFGPSIPEHETLIKGIHQVPMGCWLKKGERIELYQYYQLKAKPHTDTPEASWQKVHELVQNAIESMMTDTNASFLSGGLDSSIITAICASQQKDWHTYSLEYEGNAENFKGNMYQVSLDDTYINEMIERYTCEHTTCKITQQTLCDKLQEAVLAREFPGMADIDSSLLWLCECVADKEKIILSGECSDEIFGGYPWFYREELKDLQTFPWLQSTKERMSLLHTSLQTIDIPGYIQEQYEKSIKDISYLASDTEDDRRARLHTILCLHWFMQTLVVRQITMSRAANITIRAPFADIDTLEYVYNIPWATKFYKKQEKGILRKAFEKELPEDICWRKKNPFPKTHNPVYADLIANLLQERYLDKSSPLHVLFDDQKLKDLIASKGASYTLPWYGQLMSGPQLLAYLYQIDFWIVHYQIRIEK